MNDYVSPGMYFCSANAQNVANIPPDSITGAFSLLVEYSGAYGNGCKQTFTEHNPGITYIRRMSDISAGHWSAWEPIATATPPQEFDLPLADGIIATSWGASLYWKNQFDEVTVLLFVASSSGTISSQQMVALLPAGFRPSNRVSAPAYCNMSSGANGFVSIEPSGEIYITNSSNDVFLNGCAMISFIAAD